MAHKWATWLLNPCRLGHPTAEKQGTESEVAHKWARWLYDPYRLAGPHHFRPGGRITIRPQGGKVATKSLPSRGCTPLRGGTHIHKWCTGGQGGYITTAACGVPTASKRGAESQPVQKWARWLYNPCRLGGPHHFKARSRIRGGPQVAKVPR